ncbi:MAG: RDD family protein [Akkermansia sp.]|nr:RDD family protein [Akkermansia sp.]
MDIYWIKDKQRRGPASVPDVVSLVQMGELTPETLGWHNGCNGWQPLKELPALVDFLGDLKDKSKTLPPEAPESDIKELPPVPQQPSTVAPVPSINITVPPSKAALISGEVTLPRPATRLAARLIDCSLYAALSSATINLFGLEYSDLLMMLFWLPLIPLEAAILSQFGATPGKAVMGITLSTFGTGQQMSFGRALFRSISVNLIGMGCFLFPICLITMLISYFMLTRRGITMWDAQSLTLPLQIKKPRILHYMIAFFIIYFTAQIAAFNLVSMPGAIEVIEQTSPETARSLREMMPELSAAKSSAESTQPSTPQPL